MPRRNGSTRKALLVGGLLALGIILIYVGLVLPYPIRDMNGDGKIDWKDYDVNGDGCVDVYDVAQVGVAYGSSIGDPKYNSRVDFNGDGVIDDYDVNAIKSYFGQGLSLIDLWAYRATTPKGIQAILGFICIISAAVISFAWKVKK